MDKPYSSFIGISLKTVPFLYAISIFLKTFARTYYLKDNSIGGIGQKTVLKMYFKGYPQIKEILKGLSMKEIRKDPTILVRKLDEVLE